MSSAIFNATQYLAPALALTLSACLVEPAPAPRRDLDSSYGPAPTPSVPAPSAVPRVGIDTNKTLVVSPGDGAGVFVTYASGGNWSIQWTCDSHVNPGSSCPFDIAVGVNNANAVSAVPSTALIGRDATGIRAQISTEATLDSMHFQATPGASITLSVMLRGVAMPNLVFFVSDGVLHTEPTDPIEFVPSAP
ncbi:MAG: hypothetical protein NVS3B20_21660 [Polyangiales bacterium]